MELREYIREAAERAGGLTNLGFIVGVSQSNLSHQRAHRQRMPIEAAVKLADYLEVDRFTVIAAAEMAAAKTDEQYDFWEHLLNHCKAASIALAISLSINFVTPTPAEAAPRLESHKADFVLCKIRYLISMLKQGQLPRAVQDLIKRTTEALIALFPLRVTQI